MKCSRTACPNEAGELVHIQLGSRYCQICTDRINEANGEQLIVSLEELAGRYREQRFRILELTPLMAVARAADLVHDDAYIENKDIKLSEPNYSVGWKFIQALRNALDRAKQNAILKAEIEKI